MTGAPQTPPGWYPDPQVPGQQRYWDGTAWTQSAAPAAQQWAQPAGPGGQPPKRSGGIVWLIPVVLCLALAGIAIVGGIVVAGRAEDKLDDIDVPNTTAVPGGPRGEADEVDDVTVESGEKDPTTGWGKATITVTNDSSKPSTYSVTVKFEDGSTSYGTGVAFINELAPGQSTTQEVSSIQDFPSGTCKVAEVERLAS